MIPVNKSQAFALAERLRTASNSYQEDPDNRDLMAHLYDARNAVVKAKNKLRDYYWSCAEKEVDEVSGSLNILEQALDTIIA
jgi:hypothetical protein